MQAKKYRVLAVLIAAAALTYGLSCRTMKSTPGKKEGKKYAEPISVSVQARNHQSGIAFMLLLQDANGEKVKGIVLPTGKRPAAPKVTIVDAEGNEVYKFSMQYG